MELYKDQFVTFVYNESLHAICEYWTPATEDMEAEDMKKFMLMIVDWFRKYKGVNYLSYAIDFRFAINIDIQKWIDETVSPEALKTGMTKIARVVSADFISQLSLEQFAEEKNVSQIQNKFFDNVADAEAWLKE